MATGPAKKSTPPATGSFAAYRELHGRLRRGGVPCWCCSLPERDEIEAAYADGASVTEIVKYLTDPIDQRGRGYSTAEVTSYRVGHHVRAHSKYPRKTP